MNLPYAVPGSVFLSIALISGVYAVESPTLRVRPQVIDARIQIGYGLAIADVDGDGREDILLADAREIAWYRSPTWQKFVMARELTTKDNVCIAARDIDGDGKAEVAVGAEWNPGDTVNSGAVFFLDRPADPTQRWRPVKLDHEPTTHRMHWFEVEKGSWLLAVLPLHGRENKNGDGLGVRFLGYRKPPNLNDPWPTVELSSAFHLTHNFDLQSTSEKGEHALLVAAKEGVHSVSRAGDRWRALALSQQPSGEVRGGRAPNGSDYLTTIEPMHGNQLVVYRTPGGSETQRILLDDTLVQGHAIATGDLLGLGYDQIIAGWRGGGVATASVGIKLFVANDPAAGSWRLHGRVDDNQMACEDLKLADLDRDGRLDVIACGRATKNVIIYWNETDPTKKP